MSEQRHACAAVVLSDGVAVLGGSNGEKSLASMEKFDCRMQQWLSMPPMRHPRKGLSAVLSPDSRFIYAIGGQDCDALSVVERYSVADAEWTEVEGLKTPRYNQASVLGV
jgi:hypothetical protein